jgi:hypothetical protein
MQSALDDDMDLNEVLEDLVHFGQHEWIPLWVIVQDAEDLVGGEDEDRILETTVALARGLLQRGFRAGDGPMESAVRFHAWRNQNPDSIADFIRQQWTRRDDFPDWGDGPWFALPHELRIPCPRSIN